MQSELRLVLQLHRHGFDEIRRDGADELRCVYASAQLETDRAVALQSNASMSPNQNSTMLFDRYWRNGRTRPWTMRSMTRLTGQLQYPLISSPAGNGCTTTRHGTMRHRPPRAIAERPRLIIAVQVGGNGR